MTPGSDDARLARSADPDHGHESLPGVDPTHDVADEAVATEEVGCVLLAERPQALERVDRRRVTNGWQP